MCPHVCRSEVPSTTTSTVEPSSNVSVPRSTVMAEVVDERLRSEHDGRDVASRLDVLDRHDVAAQKDDAVVGDEDAARVREPHAASPRACPAHGSRDPRRAAAAESLSNSASSSARSTDIE